ncbi:DUF6491 family protein [Dyella caseinilytica]|uniref:Uncharacterized protein n=1 Tax=Dyella caseinilytica TaxID=1849581 RepID=A0ABX7GRU9_9GAMM|nr:DUF6491 family protein [Dyella caseinilytica]QRN53156.1 hypothetical protein ISN74_17215 [Dyella caseinilytica]GGA11887.1 hypothetical protein GCM10011408_36650 [Dyella caseinilytica]
MSTIRMVGAALLAVWMTACSNVPVAQRDQQRQQAYNAAAGAPIRSFRFMTRIWSWEPLSDSQLVVYTVPNTAYLLDVWTCPNLPWTQAIGLTSTLRSVSVNFDKVLTGRNYVPCTITKIRPINLAQLKIEQAAQREVDVQARDNGNGVAAPANGTSGNQ